MNPQDIICPTCNSQFNNPFQLSFLECHCPFTKFNSISRDLKVYYLHLNDLQISSIPNGNHQIIQTLLIKKSVYSLYLNCYIPLILQDNVLQIDKMIDKFNKLYTLS